MKSLTLATAFFLMFSTAITSAQNTDNRDPSAKYVSTETQLIKFQEVSILDRLQKETEDISVMKPILFIATIIDSRLQLHRLERESVAAAKARESGTR